MKTGKFLLVAAIAVAIVSCGQSNGSNKRSESDVPVYLDNSKPIEERVEDALSRMTLEEKVAMLHAQSKFSSAGVPRLGIPEIWCSDGPHGIRAELLWDKWSQAGWTNDSCTAYPALTCLAATWNKDLAYLYGKSIGEEALYRKKTVLLGPGVNICRTPLNGRSFEYMGEDPYLSSKMVAPYVQGVQTNGVAACVKHFALNNQEFSRNNVNVTVDDRTLYEIYLPAFKSAVEDGGAWAVMGSYNQYKGQFNCQNKYLLKDILKGEWGFDGVVISDWGGAHDTDACAANGLDLEYGTWTNGLTEGVKNAFDMYHLAYAYQQKLKSGELPMSDLDDKVRRILRLEFRTNMKENRGYGKFTCPEHYAAARKIGAEGIVLLKNDNSVLPIKSAKKILVVGENAIKMMTIGGGSSSLKVQHEILPIDGIKARFADAEIVYERGYVGDVTGEYGGVTSGQNLDETRTPEKLIADAAKAAADADYVIFIGGLNKSDHQDAEGADRLQYDLPYGQDAVIEALAAANPKTVVVNISGNAVAMPWASNVPAIIQDWYLGSEAGNSLADILSGDVNPSGKLPFTIGATYEDFPIKTEEQYPGIVREDERYGQMWEENYSEGIYVGYRWFEAKSIAPAFAFGHGLSYTTFEYGDATVSGSPMKADGKVTVSVKVKNAGSVAGAEVVQLYITDPEASVDRPAKELKGFEKISLESGETKTVTFTVGKDALSFFDSAKHEWTAEKGEFVAQIGSASDDIRTKVSFELK